MWVNSLIQLILNLKLTKMTETSLNEIKSIIESQKKFFESQSTKKISFRIEQLKKFHKAIDKFEKKISDALWQDLGKSYEEAYLTEISLVKQEIKNHIRHIKRWSRTSKIHTPLYMFPSKSRIIYEPLGLSLIIAPWNYPFQLLMNPLVGAISAGCCSVLKPSPYTPTVANVMQQMIEDTFDKKYIAITQGGRNVNTELLNQRFDVIFFTGSPNTGKVVMKAASQFLTPVVLELGGKSPCIVDKDANIDVAAKRIAWGKTINSGQTCIAPDYLFAHSSVKDELIKKIAQHFKTMFGDNIKESKFYPRIVNKMNVERLQTLMEHGKIVEGGDVDIENKYISPTIIDDVKPDFPIMQQEIFGPLLPVMTFEKIDEVISYVTSHEKPLAFYYFGKNAKQVFSRTSSGGACINDTIMHIVNDKLPFGGVGNSGMAKYHGKESFLAFCNRRAVVNTATFIDLPLKYAPYKRFGLLKKLL